MDAKLLSLTAKHAEAYFDSLNKRPVRESATREELIAMLGGPLPEKSEEPALTIDLLAKAGEVGTVACSGPRYFGFVIGGSVPAAQAADWLTTTWDQNAGLYAVSPLNSVAEEISSGWLLDVLGLPKSAAVGFVTGAMMANCSGLAAARHDLLSGVGWDVESFGLQGAPKLNIIVGEEVHVTVLNSLRVLGLGAATPKKVKVDNQGRMVATDLAKMRLSVRTIRQFASLIEQPPLSKERPQKSGGDTPIIPLLRRHPSPAPTPSPLDVGDGRSAVNATTVGKKSRI